MTDDPQEFTTALLTIYSWLNVIAAGSLVIVCIWAFVRIGTAQITKRAIFILRTIYCVIALNLIPYMVYYVVVISFDINPGRFGPLLLRPMNVLLFIFVGLLIIVTVDHITFRYFIRGSDRG